MLASEGIALPGVCDFSAAGIGAGAGAGVSSTALWTPVVHGGIDRNSSKVKTRVLQHFQPSRHDQHNRTWQ
jgi:hypothetical protein